MSDTAPTPDVKPEDHQPATSGVAQADPPPAPAPEPASVPQVVSEAQVGAETPPEGGAALPGDAPPVPTAEPVVGTSAVDVIPPPAGALIETPVQGAAVIADAPIPPPDAQPITEQPTAQPAPAGTPTEVLVAAVEHPLATIERLRAKLYEYGEECYAAVRDEIERLMRHHSP